MQYLSNNGLSQHDNAADANTGAWSKGNPNKAYAKFFVGESYLAGVTPKNINKNESTALPLANVTFEPG